MTDNFNKPKILIVDDTPENIHVLMETLKDKYLLVAAKDGEKALQLAGTEPLPEIILLDIMMPGMDGYEVCARLKSDNKTKDIPVIFITAKTEVEDELKGLNLGAVDYITKPISPPVVRARVETHLSLKKAREILQIHNEELKEAARLREDVENIMRHDLKSPLNSIISLPEIMMQERKFEPEDVEDLKTIEESGYRMLNMINLSLDLFKMERGTYQFLPLPVDLLKVIKKIFSEVAGVARSKKISLDIVNQDSFKSETDSFLILGEELLCYSMFSNLIKNAIEASSEGENVTVSFEKNELGCVCIHNQGEVPKEIADKFFEKYATSGKSGGTGLGTYSARLMAETQEGNIKLESSRENGTTITVYLPLDQDSIEQKKGEQKNESDLQFELETQLKSIQSIRVLIVDDDEFNLKILEKLLNYPNVTVDKAGNGKAALEKIDAIPYDAVFMDMEMPVMDGLTAAREIRKKKEQALIPIFALSAHDNPDIYKKSIDAGLSDYLKKPVLKTEVLKILIKFLKPETRGSILANPNINENKNETKSEVKTGDVKDIYKVKLDLDLEELIPDFLDNKRIDLESIQEALENNDFETLRSMGHKLKGSFHMYGFKYLSTLCHEIEEAASGKDNKFINENLIKINEFLDKMIIEFAEEI